MAVWKCLVCGYRHEGSSPPETCPSCGADMNRFILLEPLPPALRAALSSALTGEAKAASRNQAFAQKADEEGYDQVARLFKAVAKAEEVHAGEYHRLLQETDCLEQGAEAAREPSPLTLPPHPGPVGPSEDNLRIAFENETKAREEYYPPRVKLAFELGREDVAYALVRARDVEARHAALYKEMLSALAGEREIHYHVCLVCGYVFDGSPPPNCPVCRSGSDQIRPVD